MFENIKTFLVDKFHKIVDDLFYTVWEVKGWVICLFCFFSGLEIGRAVAQTIKIMPAIIFGVTAYFAISFLILALFIVALALWGVKDVHEKSKWRVVS